MDDTNTYTKTLYTEKVYFSNARTYTDDKLLILSSQTMEMVYALTIGITACFKSSITKINQIILSLFNGEMTTDNLDNVDLCRTLWRKYSTDEYNTKNIGLISLSEPIELIIVQDGENDMIEDNILLMKSRLEALYHDALIVSVVVNKERKGVSVSRNYILKHAKGKYVKFCDDDDLSANANELLRIIKCSGDVDYIECCMTNATKKREAPIFTGWFPTNVIVKSDWIKQHNLYFVPSIVGEDSVWRFDLYHYLHISNSSIRVSPKSIYLIYFKSFKTTNDERDLRNYELMLELVFQHERRLFGKIPLNPALFEVLSTLVHPWSQTMKVSDYILNHPEQFEFSKFINGINVLHDELDKKYDFVPISSKLKELYKKYYSSKPEISDLNRFAARYNELKLCLTKDTKLKRLMDEYISTYNSPHFKRVFIHMSKKRDEDLCLKNGNNNKFHKLLEKMNEPLTEWSIKLEQVEYNTVNSIDDSMNFDERKYSFVPLTIFIWCWLNANARRKDDISDNTTIDTELMCNSDVNSDVSDESSDVSDADTSSTDDLCTDYVDCVLIPTSNAFYKHASLIFLVLISWMIIVQHYMNEDM